VGRINAMQAWIMSRRTQLTIHSRKTQSAPLERLLKRSLENLLAQLFIPGEGVAEPAKRFCRICK
jgi:hypothetical protein